MANIPFRVSAGNGTVLLVKPSTPLEDTGSSTNVSSMPAPASKPSRSNIPPPFAQPGIQRMRQQQADQRKRKITPSGVTSQYYPSEEVLSMSPSKFASKLESTLKQRLKEEELAQQQQQGIHQSERDHFNNSVGSGAGAGTGSGSIDAEINAQQLANHRQKLILNQNRSVAQQVKLQKAAINKRNNAQQQLQQQLKQYNQQTDTSTQHFDGESNYHMLISGTLPLEWTDNRANLPQQQHPTSTGNSNGSNSSGSLFSQILSGQGSSAGGIRAAVSGSSRNHANPSDVENEYNTGEDVSVVAHRTGPSHNSAALDVSMSGYEDEDAQSRSCTSSRIRSAALAALGTSSNDDVGTAQEFGCEFSFL